MYADAAVVYCPRQAAINRLANAGDEALLASLNDPEGVSRKAEAVLTAGEIRLIVNALNSYRVRDRVTEQLGYGWALRHRDRKVIVRTSPHKAELTPETEYEWAD